MQKPIENIERRFTTWAIKEFLLENDGFISLAKLSSEKISKSNFYKIFVNGDWIGCCLDPLKIIYDYNQYKNKFEQPDQIDKIYVNWDRENTSIYFWTYRGGITTFNKETEDLNEINNSIANKKND